MLLDLLYPRSCCSCGVDLNPMRESGLCWECRCQSIAIQAPYCEQCGMPIAGRVDHAFVCSRCIEHPPKYTKARSLYRYEGGVRDAIHALKYHRDFSVIPDLGTMLLAGIEVYAPQMEVLAAVPLHPARQRFRGFNQGEELLRWLRRHRKSLQVWKGLKRVKNTESQVHFHAEGRRKNVRGAFRVKKGVPVPQSVLLVDDVMTTGSTLDACASALCRAGVKEVQCLTLARG